MCTLDSVNIGAAQARLTVAFGMTEGSAQSATIRVDCTSLYPEAFAVTDLLAPAGTAAPPASPLGKLRAELRAAGWSARSRPLSAAERAEMIRDYGLGG